MVQFSAFSALSVFSVSWLKFHPQSPHSSLKRKLAKTCQNSWPYPILSLRAKSQPHGSNASRKTHISALTLIPAQSLLSQSQQPKYSHCLSVHCPFLSHPAMNYLSCNGYRWPSKDITKKMIALLTTVLRYVSLANDTGLLFTFLPRSSTLQEETREQVIFNSENHGYRNSLPPIPQYQE